MAAGDADSEADAGLDPGVIIKAEEARWIAANFPSLTEVHIGDGLHYVQEDRPHEIGEAIADWRSQLSKE